MNPPGNDLLLLAGRVLTLLIQGVMAVAAAVIAITAICVLTLQNTINAEIRAEFGADFAAMPVPAVLGLLAVVLVMVGLVFLFFGKLRGIIETVAQGDPFVPDNADRLNAMAWLQIGTYIAGMVAVGAAALVADWAEQFTDVDIDGSIDVDVPSILLVIILFILARVFRQGAAMRADLEGTV
jgi:Protein of unknown function (DUF2975)